MRARNVDESDNHVGSDPWDIFTQLAILIIEGRTPGGEKGYHAGPHCPLPHHAGGYRHVCDPNSTMCVKIDSYLRQLRLMWGVGVGVTVEVLVAPECGHGSAFTTATLDTTTAPSPLLTLIEQWNFTIYDRDKPEATSTGRSLVAAVRSFLHFSQLSAWLSVSGGARPPNVLYRLIVTSPVFCSKFESGSENHKFPIAYLGQDTSLKVVVHSLPRSSKVPIPVCFECNKDHQPLHHEASASAPIAQTSSSSEQLVDAEIINSSSEAKETAATNSSKSDGNINEDDLRRSIMRARLGDPSRASRSESPDTQLGESLLDPPHSLSRIPRRFQSPSRSGSPSMETPEHIMCRTRTPGPSHGRPPDVFGIQQQQHPLIQPPNPSLAWTQTRHPFALHYHHEFAPPPSEPVSFDRTVGEGAAVPFAQQLPPFTPTENQQFFWSQISPLPTEHPPPSFPNSSLYQMFPSSNHQTPDTNSFSPFYQNFSQTPLLNFENSSSSSNVPHSDSGVIVPSPVEDQLAISIYPPSITATTCPLRINVDANCSYSGVDGAQGTKRKGTEEEEAKESPRNKRESPPHVYYSKEGKGAADMEEKRRRSSTDSDDLLKREDLLKRKIEEADYSSPKKNTSPSKREIDELWPSCSQAGKHLCSSLKDYEKYASIKELKNDRKKLPASTSTCSKLDKSLAKLNFDLTPKETQEVLSVLRQNAPLPPLRIGTQHRNSSAECSLLSTNAKEIKLRRRSAEVDYRSKLSKAESDYSWFLNGGKDGGRRDDAANAASSNERCDTNFKQPNNRLYKHTKYFGNDLEDDTIEDGLSPEEIAKIRNGPNFTQARTVIQNTKFFTAKSQPRTKESECQTSQALLKSPPNSVLSSIQSVSIDSNSEANFKDSKARRTLIFDSCESPKMRENNLIESSSSNKSGRETREGFTKGVHILKRLMKNNIINASQEESVPSPENSVCSPEDTLDNRFREDELESDANSLCNDEEDREVEEVIRTAKGIPSTSDKVKFRRSLDSAASLVFHNKTGLPLTSSPAPLRKGGTRFDFDSSLNSVAAIRSAFRNCEEEEELLDEENENWLAKDYPTTATIIRPSTIRSLLSSSAPATVTCSNLLGSFEECVLNGRLEPVSIVHGFSAEIAASGAFCPKHISKPVTAFFYTLCDNDQISSPYMGHINLGKKGYHVPSNGTVQVTLFNPHGTVVKMFVVMYNLSDMPPNSKTFLRQRTLNMPMGASDKHPDAHQWLRYLIHLRFASSKSGKIYLHTDIRMLIFRKSDADAATLHKNSVPYELRSFTHGPVNPKFSPRK